MAESVSLVEASADAVILSTEPQESTHAQWPDASPDHPAIRPGTGCQNRCPRSVPCDCEDIDGCPDRPD